MSSPIPERATIDIRPSVQNNRSIIQSVLGLHALTGADIVAAISNIGRKICIQNTAENGYQHIIKLGNLESRSEEDELTKENDEAGKPKQKVEPKINRECFCGKGETIDKLHKPNLNKANYNGSCTYSVGNGPVEIGSFVEFFHNLQTLYDECLCNVSGNLSNCIPTSSKRNNEYWVVSLCTVDGQRKHFGDENISFTLQQCTYPINFCIATEQHIQNKTHKQLLQYSEDGVNNSIDICNGSITHNPLSESGAVIMSSLLSPDKTAADQFEDLLTTWKRLVGGTRIGYSNASFLHTKSSANNIFALGYLMKERRIFPSTVKVPDVVDAFIQNCSLTATAEQLSVAAATLANGGVCPITGNQVFSVEIVRKCLSLMLTSGMGEKGDEINIEFCLPAKSCKSGAIMLIVPNMMGICIYSPRLDDKGQSSRGVEFITKLCNKYQLNVLQNLKVTDKLPRRHSIF